MKRPTNNIIVELWLKRELLASIAIYYEKQNISFRNLPELIRQTLKDFERMIVSSGGDRIIDPLEASSVLRRLGLRGHKETRSGSAYLKALQFSQHQGEPMFTEEDALREIEKATDKAKQRDQKEKNALIQGPDESTVIKEE